MCVYHFVGVKRILKSRADMIANRQADWALGEAFAVGSLLMEQVSSQLFLSQNCIPNLQ